MILNQSQMSISDLLSFLGSIWYHSEPLKVPYFPNQFLGLDFFCRFLQQTGSSRRCMRSLTQVGYHRQTQDILMECKFPKSLYPGVNNRVVFSALKKRRMVAMFEYLELRCRNGRTREGRLKLQLPASLYMMPKGTFMYYVITKKGRGQKTFQTKESTLVQN